MKNLTNTTPEKISLSLSLSNVSISQHPGMAPPCFRSSSSSSSPAADDDEAITVYLILRRPEPHNMPIPNGPRRLLPDMVTHFLRRPLAKPLPPLPRLLQPLLTSLLLLSRSLPLLLPLLPPHLKHTSLLEKTRIQIRLPQAPSLLGPHPRQIRLRIRA